jgi:hypothetical protein
VPGGDAPRKHKVHSGGRGRWIADRNPCGKMTRARAEKRIHAGEAGHD